MSAIPTSTSVSESAVIPSSLSKVWHLIKLQSFHRFWSKLAAAEYLKNETSPETDVVKWTFKDGTVLEVKQEEHSVRTTLSPIQTPHLLNIDRIALPIVPLANSSFRLVDNRPLHHLQHHLLDSASKLHLRRLHHPLLGCHLRYKRRLDLRPVDGQFLQRC